MSDEFEYTVVRMGKSENHFEITKWEVWESDPLEQYDVTLKEGSVWCNCLGFTRMKAPKETHKHILLVQMHLSRGEPVGQRYGFDGDKQPHTIGNPLDLDRIPLG